jgi:hypothetical protein
VDSSGTIYSLLKDSREPGSGSFCSMKSVEFFVYLSEYCLLGMVSDLWSYCTNVSAFAVMIKIKSVISEYASLLQLFCFSMCIFLFSL